MSSLKILQFSCALAICGFGLGALAASPSATDTEQGIWQKHEYSFQFLGFTTSYSCDGLASKLKVLLIAAGARADVKSTSGACSRGYGIPDRFARAYLTFYTLSPVGHEENGSLPIGGVWRSIAIADRSPREVRLGDCELVEQFREKLLPMFTTRNVDNRMTCVPNQLSGSAINLQFEVFEALPAAKKKLLGTASHPTRQLSISPQRSQSETGNGQIRINAAATRADGSLERIDAARLRLADLRINVNNC
jgi:hypothetical protein